MSDRLDERETPYRVARAGYGNTIWLTRREVELANLLDVECWPSQHGDMDCPAPEVCGWFITRKDYDKIKRVQALSQDTVNDLAKSDPEATTAAVKSASKALNHRKDD